MAFTIADLVGGRFRGPRILIYHQIGSGIGRQMEVTTEDFSWQMKWLGEHFRVVDLETAVAQRGAVGSESLVVVSFDDGYGDFYRHGYPVLREFRIPFVLYLTTDPVENRRLLGPPSAIPLKWDQVTDMISSGLTTLGVHTHTHPDLRFLDSGRIEAELSVSDELVRRRTGVEPRHFAYPWGYWSAPADALIRRRYESAVLGAGPPVTSGTDPFLLHRIPIQLSDGRFFFRRKLATGLRLEETVRRWVNGYQGP